MLIRLIYYSKVGNIKGIYEINEILEKSKVNNAKLSVTGMLFFDEKYFIQVLEGNRDQVSELMLKIAKDERHHDVVLVDISEISSRKFTKWNMVYAGGAQIDNKDLMQFSPSESFDPSRLTKNNFVDMINFIYDNVKK